MNKSDAERMVQVGTENAKLLNGLVSCKKKDSFSFKVPERVTVRLTDRQGAISKIRNYNIGYSIAARFITLPKPDLKAMYEAFLKELQL